MICKTCNSKLKLKKYTNGEIVNMISSYKCQKCDYYFEYNSFNKKRRYWCILNFKDKSYEIDFYDDYTNMYIGSSPFNADIHETFNVKNSIKDFPYFKLSNIFNNKEINIEPLKCKINTVLLLG